MIQMQEPIETAELLAFARVVDAKSLSRAAAELGVPRATIGRRLARLEQRLGTRLLRRTTRSLALTDAGENFYRQARIVLDAVRAAEASVRESSTELRGNVRVSVPSGMDGSFRQLVTAFVKEHPEVRVQVEFSTRLVDLVREGYDVALRATTEVQPGLIARVLGRHRALAVASPEYIAKHGMPRSARELRGHRCLTGFARGELPQSTWPAGRSTVHVESVLSSNDLALLRQAALDGLGIALLPSLIVEDLLERKALVPVLPGIVEAENVLAVVYPERELMPPQVRAFIDRLVKWGAELFTREDPCVRRRPARKAR